MGASALSTEFLCLDVRSKTLKQWLPKMNELCGFDIMAFYKKYSVQQGYLRLNRKIKEPFFNNMRDACLQVGMRFYVSDAHFKEMCANGSCCGLPTNWNYSRGQFCEALQIAKKNGVVTYGEIENEINAIHSKTPWSRATGYNTKSCEARSKFAGMSMADYMRYLWNNPQNGQSPYKLFEGALIPRGKDSHGNLVYHYNGTTE